MSSERYNGEKRRLGGLTFFSVFTQISPLLEMLGWKIFVRK